MKTKLYDLPDWQQMLQEIGWADAPTEEQIEKEIVQELTRGRVTFTEQPAHIPIEKSCRVTLRMESVLPKFNKEKVVVTVGAGLYDATVETALCGMVVGQKAEVTIKGENVSFTVLKAEKKQYPVLTDAFVQDLQVEGISSLAAYRRYMEQKIRAEYAARLGGVLLEKLLPYAKTDIPAQEDIQSVIELEYEPLRVRFKLDEMTPKEWKEGFGKVELRKFYAQIYPDVALLFGTADKESFFESRREAAKKTILDCLLLGAIVGSDADPTQDSKAEQKMMQILESRILKMIYGG